MILLSGKGHILNAMVQDIQKVADDQARQFAEEMKMYNPEYEPHFGMKLSAEEAPRYIVEGLEDVKVNWQAFEKKRKSKKTKQERPQYLYIECNRILNLRNICSCVAS